MNSGQRVAILGGTFDPIHYGHLVAAEIARYQFQLDRVIFMPAARPPHKELNSILSRNHRYRMVCLAIEDNQAFIISDLEMQRPGNSYTIDTIDYFISQQPQDSFYFIMGMDSLLSMHSWKDIARLSTLCQFIVVTRPNYVLDLDMPSLQQLPQQLWDNLHIMAIPGVDISSTDIRQRVREGQPIKYLLPAQVEQYVNDHGLYQRKEKDDCIMNNNCRK
ncbi:MAG: nicotinate-nucleotide adenylyltransferase [Syntrophomonadaceae bacterium]